MSLEDSASPLGVFSKLPAEIRNEIYYHTLNLRAQEGMFRRGFEFIYQTEDGAVHNLTSTPSSYDLGINLLLSSKALYAEAGDYFYYHNDLIRFRLPWDDFYRGVKVTSLLDENSLFHYFWPPDHKVRACARHALDISVCRPGNVEFADLMICASQVEHVVHYLAAFLLANVEDKNYDIHVNLRTAKPGILDTALRPLQGLRGFRHTHFTISPAIRRSITPLIRREFRDITTSLAWKYASFSAWLATSNNFLDNIERLLEAVPPPIKQLDILLEYIKSFTAIPEDIESTLRAMPFLYAGFTFFAARIWFVDEVCLETRGAGHTDAEWHRWIPGFTSMVLKLQPELGRGAPQTLVLRAFRMLSGAASKFRDRSILNTILSETLESCIKHNFDVLTKEVRQELDRLGRT